MKRTGILLLLLAFAFATQAQTKKTTKTTPAKKTAQTAGTAKTTTTTAKTEEKKSTTTKSASQPATTKKSQVIKPDDEGYQTAIGVKFLYGLALTGKHFFTPEQAGEAIVHYRNYSGFGSEANLSLLYEYHGRIEGAPGLRWYGGGGVYAGYFSYKDDNFVLPGYKSGGTYFGLSGVLGLEYKFHNAPIAISADWQPVFLLKDYYTNSGFAAEGGGLGVKYTF